MNLTRIIIAGLLLAYFSLNGSKAGWISGQVIYPKICIAYLLLALAFAVLSAYSRRRFLLQLSTQIAADTLVISALYVVAGGAKSGLAILYLFPLAGAAILATLMLALFFVSVVALFLLAASGYRALTLDGDAAFMQAGLYGAAFFAVVFVVNRLAARLIRQEHLAARRGMDLQIQQAINRLVIADMGDGILVVDHGGAVLMGNPAAERMLGVAGLGRKPVWRLGDIPAFAPIADAFLAWSAASEKPVPVPVPVPVPGQAEAPIFVFIKPAAEVTLAGATSIWGGRRELFSHVKLRFVAVDTDDPKVARTIIFLRDVSEIENQAQQLKLASMGRLTASIAHEVRNPLAAISHAAALLREEAGSPVSTRLLTIVADNVARVNRMIEDILNLSRKAQLHDEPFALLPALADIVREFEDAHHLPAAMIALNGSDAPDASNASDKPRVRFDPMHLREVVVNLLSNAIRYASRRPASIRMHVASDDADRLELHVQDDGPGIAAAVRSHLFEPFHTTSSKGTGLGLYLARELCLNNGAMLDYEYRIGHVGHVGHVDQRGGEPSGRFVITFALPHSA
ncbi:PAS domain-containing sensor histidine kinase [Herminiimonas sp. CN]|uniref:sensor histidine kinase n=1 Tax=Herminiimonas sp. CN TaxID=1349818 RepID=UPI00350EC354